MVATGNAWSSLSERQVIRVVASARKWTSLSWRRNASRSRRSGVRPWTTVWRRKVLHVSYREREARSERGPTTPRVDAADLRLQNRGLCPSASVYSLGQELPRDALLGQEREPAIDDRPGVHVRSEDEGQCECGHTGKRNRIRMFPTFGNSAAAPLWPVFFMSPSQRATSSESLKGLSQGLLPRPRPRPHQAPRTLDHRREASGQRP